MCKIFRGAMNRMKGVARHMRLIKSWIFPWLYKMRGRKYGSSWIYRIIHLDLSCRERGISIFYLFISREMESLRTT